MSFASSFSLSLLSVSRLVLPRVTPPSVMPQETHRAAVEFLSCVCWRSSAGPPGAGPAYDDAAGLSEPVRAVHCLL